MSDTHQFTGLPRLKRLRSRALVAALFSCACALVLLHPAAAAPGQARTPDSGGAGESWVHYATAANTYASWTDLDNELTNNNPAALVFVTPSWNPGGVSASAFDYARVGVWYNFATHKWSIFNQDNSPMPVGAAFEVHANGIGFNGLFASTVTAANLSADSSSADLINAFTDGRSAATLIVTPTWNGVYDNHPLGVFYHYETGHWALFHEDGAPMTPGAAYNIADAATWDYYSTDVHTTTSANTAYGMTQLDDPHLNGNPNAIVSVTQRWTEYYCFRSPWCTFPTARNNSAVSVVYSSGSWYIYNNAGALMPLGAQFTIIIW